MKKKERRKKHAREAAAHATSAGRVTPDADLTWLLHLAAQRMRAAMDEESARHRIHLRDYIVLTALETLEQSTQLALGRALGLDKTTLTLELDRLEKKGLIVRRAAPRDRRIRIPEATDAGRALQVEVTTAAKRVETDLLARFSASERRALRLMLCELIETGAAETRSGSCL